MAQFNPLADDNQMIRKLVNSANSDAVCIEFTINRFKHSLDLSQLQNYTDRFIMEDDELNKNPNYKLFGTELCLANPDLLSNRTAEEMFSFENSLIKLEIAKENSGMVGGDVCCINDCAF